jgi:molybdopterin/thiamine biosynthesis adenylyltransferase
MATLNCGDKRTRVTGSKSSVPWSYAEAFKRHRGLINEEEQARLRTCRVGVVGMGGVGGVDLVTLARLGIGKFTIADPDIFEVSNTNRQHGAMSSTLGRRKADVMAEIVQDINPEAELRVFPEAIGAHNAEAFLEGVDVLVDGIDAFEIDLRRLLFRLARERGIYALGAGPVGFSTVWVVFSPDDMSFDQYFDLRDDMDSVEKFAAYIAGMAPKATHRGYIDMSQVNVSDRAGPSVGFACQLAAGVIGAEVVKILLKRGPLRPAPHYHQFDAYLGKLVRRRLWGGNRHPLQRIKRRILVHFLRQHLGEPERP